MNTKSASDFWMMDRLPDPTSVATYGSSIPFNPRSHPNNFSRIGAVYPGHGTPTPWLTEIGSPPFDGSEFQAYASYGDAREAVIAALPVRTVWVEAVLPSSGKVFYRWNLTDTEIEDLDNEVLKAITNDPRLLHPSSNNKLSGVVNTVVDSLDIDVTLLRLRRRGLID